jgi:hypothetical protein
MDGFIKIFRQMKKIIILILVINIPMILTSCHSYTYISNIHDFETHQNKEHIYALDLITGRDSMVYFSSRFPGRLSNNEVKGPRQVLLQDFKPDSVHFGKKNKIRYVIKDSIRYKVTSRNDTLLVYLVSDSTRIPFSEIKQIHIKEFDNANTTLGIIGIVVTTAGLVIGIFALLFSNMSA